MNKSCIYVIVNLTTKSKYIGSASNIDNRIRAHLWLLGNNIHTNVHLQRSWNKYGKENFIFHILEWCSKEDRIRLEQIYIDGLKPEYNISKSASCPMEGRKHSDKTKLKMSNRIPWNIGVPRTEEEKLLMSSRRIEEYSKKSDEYKEKHRQRTREWHKNNEPPFKGKHHTEENKKYLRSIRKSKYEILCINTNEIFEAQIDISKKYNLKQGHISEVLNGKRPHVKGFKFIYLKDKK